MSAPKRFKHPEPTDGAERFRRNQTLWAQRAREENMWAVLAFQLQHKVTVLEKMCASAEYIGDYDFHTKARTEIADLKTTLAGAEREYHIKRFAYDVALRDLDFGKFNCDRDVKGWTTEHYWEYEARHNGGMEVHALGPVHL